MVMTPLHITQNLGAKNGVLSEWCEQTTPETVEQAETLRAIVDELDNLILGDTFRVILDHAKPLHNDELSRQVDLRESVKVLAKPTYRACVIFWKPIRKLELLF